MTPEISEFSYGFALTNEIVAWKKLSIAPVFPSLLEEGKTGGGYDVKLGYPGVPLYLQFKRADCMTKKSASEIKNHNLPLNIPFYRFKITESGKSNQHKMLLDLDDGQNLVLYAAPRFHELSEINLAWKFNQVASKSIFISPGKIGILDQSSHHVAFDNELAFLCSAFPKEINFWNARDLSLELERALAKDVRPLEERLPEFMDSLNRRLTSVQRLDLGLQGSIDAQIEAAQPIRSPSSLSEPKQILRDLADIAARLFGLQFYIVQAQ